MFLSRPVAYIPVGSTKEKLDNVNVDMKFLMPPFPNLKTKNNMRSLEPLSPFSLQALARNESSAPVSQSPANP